MEEVTIEVEDPDDVFDAKPDIVEEFSLIDQLAVLLTTYGWLLMIGAFLAYFVWRKWGQPRYEKWQDDQHAARYHKDPDIALARMRAVEAARQRLQAEHDALAAAHAEKMRQKEEQKRQDKIEEWEHNVKGAPSTKKRLAAASNDLEASTSAATRKTSGKARLRNNDYNPLMGAGGSSGYRAAGRSCFGSPRGGA